jgi:hypothetical protein
MVDPVASYLEITEVETTIHSWSTSEFLSESTREAISKASVLIIPQMGFRDYSEPLFPVGTTELFSYLRSAAETNLNIEIAIDDEDYREIALHSDIVRIATIVVEYYVAPILSGLLVNYITSRLGRGFTEGRVEATVVVADSDGVKSRSWELKYKGPAKTFENFLKTGLSQLADRKVSTLNRDSE